MRICGKFSRIVFPQLDGKSLLAMINAIESAFPGVDFSYKLISADIFLRTYFVRKFFPRKMTKFLGNFPRKKFCEIMINFPGQIPLNFPGKPDFPRKKNVQEIDPRWKYAWVTWGQFFKTSVGARKAKSNTGVGANFWRRRKNPFKKLPSDTCTQD
jgi:hypothetical protein